MTRPPIASKPSACAASAADARCRAARPRATAAAGRRPVPPPPPAAAAPRHRKAGRAAGRSSPVPPGQRRAPIRPKPPANCVAVKPCGNSSNASGFPRVSATILSRTAASNLNRTAEVSSTRATSSPCPAPPVRAGAGAPPRLASPENDPDGLGQQPTGDEGQRQRRGLVQPLRVVETQSSGGSSATAANRLSTARPTRNRSGPLRQ